MCRKSFCLTTLLVLACGSWSFVQAQDNPDNNRRPDRGPGRRQNNGQFQGRGQGRGPGQGRGFGQGRGPGQGQGQEQPQGGGPGRGRRGSGGGPPGFGPGFGGGPGGPNMSPEQRARYYDRMVNRQMDQVSQAYELDDNQKQQVRQRMAALRDEDMAGADQRWQQMNALREQYRQLGQRRAAGEQVSPEQWQQLNDQMRSTMGSSPLRNRERVMGEVEQFLPPDQAARGRERFQQQQAERDRQLEQRRQQFDQFVQQGGDPSDYFRQQRQRRQPDQNQNPPPEAPAPPPPPQAAPPDQPPPGAAGNQESDRQRRREERQRRREERRQANNGEVPADGGGEVPSGGGSIQTNDNGERRWHSRRGQELTADPLGPWERYVHDFIAKYDLDVSQQAVAQSVLRDLLKQRGLFEETHRADIAIAQQVQDPAIRKEQLESANAPVARMFDELKSKLERIPTAAQRLAVDGPPPASRPAETTTRPAGEPTTRPARERRGPSGDNPGRPPGSGRPERG